MDGTNLASGGNGGPGGLEDIIVKFGDDRVAIACQACKRMSQSGFFVDRGMTRIHICVKCVAQLVVNWQNQHIGQALFEEDCNVPDEAYNKMAKRLQEVIPGVSDSDAVKACREVLNEI